MCSETRHHARGFFGPTSANLVLAPHPRSALQFESHPAAVRWRVRLTIHPESPMQLARRLLKGEEGIAVTEYGLLIALVAVLLIGVVTIFGSSIASWFNAKTNSITSF